NERQGNNDDQFRDGRDGRSVHDLTNEIRGRTAERSKSRSLGLRTIAGSGAGNCSLLTWAESFERGRGRAVFDGNGQIERPGSRGRNSNSTFEQQQRGQ